MGELTNIADFTSLSLSEKFNIFDEGLPKSVRALSTAAIYQLLKRVISDPSENQNIRKRALAVLTDYVLLKEIKVRQALSILIDDWKPAGDIFIELQRLKDLFLYYFEEKSDIENIFIEYLTSTEAELSSEANYLLGLIKFQESLLSLVPAEQLVLLEQSNSYLIQSIEELENRDDALFFQKTVLVLKNAVQGIWGQVEQDIETLGNILFQWQTKSIHFSPNVFFISIYRGLSELLSIRLSSPSTWLDIRNKLTAVYCHFTELQNQILKDRLAHSDVSEAFIKLLSTRFVEPYFVLNLQADLTRIDVRITEVDHASEEGVFLVYLRSLLADTNAKKKAQSDSLKRELEKIFPYRNEAIINQAMSKMTDETDPAEILNAYVDLLKPSLEKFIDELIWASVLLQGNRLYRGDFSEDDRNTYIANLMTTAGYSLKDQTRWSTSAKGKSAGEIDIYVQDHNGYPYAIIEALNLDSLKSDYIKLHLDKLFKYDTAGHEANFILIYATAKRFGDFWDKYVDLIKKHSFEYPLDGYEEVSHYKYANIKVAVTRHLRQGQQISLYHIAVDMQ